MQRIDENTYIDDSLVTCAEYQLFIDEMREQGKHYQPDHWNSYQFPKGQAGEPILGVRHSDAVAFCEWLTSRDEGVRKYRLPTQEDVLDFRLKPLKPVPIGYWIMGKNDEHSFVWVGTIPDNPRALAREILSLLQGSRIEAFDLDHSIQLVHDIDYTQSRRKSQIRNRARDLAFVRDLEILADRTRTRSTHLDKDRSISRNRALSRAHNIVSGSDRSIDSANRYAYSIMYIDILTLQERIAGRSPAFEGIRLVKERIR